MSSNDEILAQFIEVSGCEESVAEFYLSSANWSLEVALSTYLASQNDGDNATAEPPQRSEVAAPTKVSPDLGPKPATTTDNFQQGSGARPRFATLNDMAKKSPNSDEEEGQAFYAGGSDRSGQQVLGPPKRKNFREQLSDMFRMAQEQSGSDAEPMPSNSNAGNWGQGMRLGMTDNDHAVVKPASSGKGGEKKPIVMLKLWSEGFSIDDGELRPYDNPENKEFLETVMRGEIPQELLAMGWMVNLEVEDHRHENFKKKPTTLKTFKGSGHALGSPVPNIEDQSSTSSRSAAVATAPAAAAVSNTVTGEGNKDEEQAKSALNVNASQPTTTLQIRLADGSRLTGQFNLTHTVADIHSYIQNARPQYANSNFILVSSFPTRELKEMESTIEKAGLKNAALMQRIM